MKPADLMRRIMEDPSQLDYEKRQRLSGAIADRGEIVSDHIFRIFVLPELERALPSLGLIDEFPRNDRTPAIVEFSGAGRRRMTTRGKFLDDRRILVHAQIPDELKSGLFDFELSLQIGLAAVRHDDQFHNDDENQHALQNRLYFPTNPPDFRIRSDITAEAIRAEVKKRFAAVAKEATGTAAAA